MNISSGLHLFFSHRGDHVIISTECCSSDLESVASAVEVSELKDNFVPTANCVQDTKERQQVTRSGLQRMRCCVCHLHHQRAMAAAEPVRNIIKNCTSASVQL